MSYIICNSSTLMGQVSRALQVQQTHGGETLYQKNPYRCVFRFAYKQESFSFPMMGLGVGPGGYGARLRSTLPGRKLPRKSPDILIKHHATQFTLHSQPRTWMLPRLTNYPLNPIQMTMVHLAKRRRVHVLKSNGSTRYTILKNGLGYCMNQRIRFLL